MPSAVVSDSPRLSSTSYSPRFSAHRGKKPVARRCTMADKQRAGGGGGYTSVKPKFITVASQKLKVNYPFLKAPQIKMKALALWSTLSEDERENYVENQSWKRAFVHRTSAISGGMGVTSNQSTIMRSPLAERTFNSPQSSIRNNPRKDKIPSPPPKPITQKRLEKLLTSDETTTKQTPSCDWRNKTKPRSSGNPMRPAVAKITKVKVPQKSNGWRGVNTTRKNLKKSVVVVTDLYSLSSTEDSPQKPVVKKSANKRKPLLSTSVWSDGEVSPRKKTKPTITTPKNNIRTTRSTPTTKQPSPVKQPSPAKVSRITPSKPNLITTVENKSTAGKQQTRSATKENSVSSDDRPVMRSGLRLRKGKASCESGTKTKTVEQKKTEEPPKKATIQKSLPGTVIHGGRRTRSQTGGKVTEINTRSEKESEVTGSGSQKSESGSTPVEVKELPEVRRSTRSRPEVNKANNSKASPCSQEGSSVVSSTPEQDYLCQLFDRRNGLRNGRRRNVAGSPGTDNESSGSRSGSGIFA